MLPTENRLFLSMDEAIRMIGNGKLFGFCEVDIETPENKKEYFAEMCPIFKNDEVGVEDIGEYMQEFAPNDKMKRRLLIGSYYGKKIGLATPLLKWYLSKGMKITRIYRILEYKPVKAFNKFMNDVADARLMGDQQGSSLNAEIMKLIGNSAFGKTIVRKEKHRNVQFVNAQEVASGEKLDDIVHDKFKYETIKSDWLVTPSARQGKRTPGLFKVEFTGDQMISLCSKSYCISEKEQYEAESSRRFKFSMKGVNKSQFKNNPYEHYANVLNTTNTFRANNAGIRSHNGTMYTYKQRKNALTYFYPKRIVLDDGRSTKPLLL
eukprot:Seg2115.1 transcript_id=Seg2115.1/GoldUCD/mRNA.D3Y31 product="hypothetical protein" protein_id=Seg2115.1/GoldUCD/D3Y31